jgi:hypothetical protein
MWAELVAAWLIFFSRSIVAMGRPSSQRAMPVILSTPQAIALLFKAPKFFDFFGSNGLVTAKDIAQSPFASAETDTFKVVDGGYAFPFARK